MFSGFAEVFPELRLIFSQVYAFSLTSLDPKLIVRAQIPASNNGLISFSPSYNKIRARAK
jgi:hypothetical protein